MNARGQAGIFAYLKRGDKHAGQSPDGLQGPFVLPLHYIDD